MPKEKPDVQFVNMLRHSQIPKGLIIENKDKEIIIMANKICPSIVALQQTLPENTKCDTLEHAIILTMKKKILTADFLETFMKRFIDKINAEKERLVLKGINDVLVNFPREFTTELTFNVLSRAQLEIKAVTDPEFLIRLKPLFKNWPLEIKEIKRNGIPMLIISTNNIATLNIELLSTLDQDIKNTFHRNQSVERNTAVIGNALAIQERHNTFARKIQALSPEFSVIVQTDARNHSGKTLMVSAQNSDLLNFLKFALIEVNIPYQTTHDASITIATLPGMSSMFLQTFTREYLRATTQPERPDPDLPSYDDSINSSNRNQP